MRPKHSEVIGILILFVLVVTGCDNNTIQQTPIPAVPTPSATPSGGRQDVYGKANMEITAPYAVADLTFSPDGQTLVTGSDEGKTVLWRVSDGQQLRILDGLYDLATDIAFSRDGKTLATGSVGNDDTILWNVSEGTKLSTIKGGDPTVYRRALSPDGEILALTYMVFPEQITPGAVKLWRVSDGKEIHDLPADLVFDSEFSPDGQILATGHSDGSTQVWMVASGEKISTLPSYTSGYRKMTFSPDGQILVHVENKDVDLLRVSDGERLRTIEGDDVHGLNPADALFSPDGQTLAVFEYGGTITLWRVPDGQELRVISGLVMENGEKERISMAFSLDGQILVAEAADTKIRLWRFDK